MVLCQHTDRLYPGGMADEMDACIGANVKKYRLARGMSQGDVADAMSDPDEPFHQQTVLKIEKGARSLKLAEASRLADVLKVPMAFLLIRDTRTTVNAALMQHSRNISQVNQQLQDLATTLAAELTDLGYAVAMHRDEADPMQVDDAMHWLAKNWGGALNEYLLEGFRHTDLAELPSEFSDVTQIPLQLAAKEWTQSDENGAEK